MNVGLIIYGSINTITGGYIYDYQLVEYLRSQGVVVKIFSQKKKKFWRFIHDNFSQKMIHEIIEFSPDLLLEDEMNFASLFIFNKRLKKISSFPIISIVHLLQASTKQNFLARLLTKKIEGVYLKSVNGYIFNSFSTQKSIIELIGKRNNAIVAHPGKDRLQFDVTKDNIILSQNNTFMIIFIGNLLYNKGLHVLLHALAQIDCNHWQLSIVGSLDFDSKYTQKILKMITDLKLENHVKIHGPLNVNYLKKTLFSHHVLIVPSYYESYGIVYTEAMGAGLPVIACKTGGVQEIVEDEINGFLIPPGDSAMLSECISKLITNRELLKNMSSASLATYQNMPSWNESMKKVYEFLKQNTF